jgi:hypothetical protein
MEEPVNDNDHIGSTGHHLTTTMPKLAPIVIDLINTYSEGVVLGKSGVGYNVSRTVSALAVAFEKIRNAVEFRAEHLIRRAAIERILKRLVLLNGAAGPIAENLVTELLWAKYIDSSFIDEDKIAELTLIIDKYLTIKQAISAGHAAVSWEYVLGIASSEIEESIVPAKKRQALLYFFYQAHRPKISLTGVDDLQTNLITLVASERAYMQSDDALIAYHLTTLLLPNWLNNTKVTGPNTVSQFVGATQTIRTTLTHPLTAPVFRYLRRQVPPFLLLKDFFIEAGPEVRNYIDDPKKLDEKLTQIAITRYNETGRKVRRAMVRSFIYIFLTKMVFAFALEAPYDIYIMKKLAPIPLVINTIFPPLMLFLVAGLFNVPGADNTRRLIDRIHKLLYHFDDVAHEKDTFTERQKDRRPVLTVAFSFFYLATFAITFGLINIVLTALHFSIPSKIIFVFFAALVSFFAYRIRVSAKEYEMIERQGFLEPLMDFFLMPILQAGQFLSREIARLNIFIFIFDFILEAPLKVIFEVVEEWIRFIRTKKEEIV